jgi:hypothetical protein
MDIQSQISTLKDYIKNQAFVSKFAQHRDSYENELKYITLQEMLNDVSNKMFNYTITINDYKIISYGTIDLKRNSSKQYTIGGGLSCSVFVQIDKSSALVKDSITKMNKQINNVVAASIVIFLCLAAVLHHFINKDQKIKSRLKQITTELACAVERNKNIILFKESNKKFILKCYNFSKNNLHHSFKNASLTNGTDEQDNDRSSDYLPILLDTGERTVLKHNIPLSDSIISELQDYFNGYVAYYNTKMTLEIIGVMEKVKVPFEREIFSQILISLFSNVLHFNKDTENLKYIRLSFKKNIITCSSNGFLLDHNLAIRYSEKIFNDTGNLYLLNLGQIFVLLKRYKLSYFVVIKNRETIIEINLNSNVLHIRGNTKNVDKIISFNKLNENL